MKKVITLLLCLAIGTAFASAQDTTNWQTMSAVLRQQRDQSTQALQDAAVQMQLMQQQLNERDARIKQLTDEIAALKKPATPPAPVPTPPVKQPAPESKVPPAK